MRLINDIMHKSKIRIMRKFYHASYVYNYLDI